jgi:hypothetical protein
VVQWLVLTWREGRIKAAGYGEGVAVIAVGSGGLA